MQPKSLARIGAVAFVAVALTATALQMRASPVPGPVVEVAPPANVPGDGLSAELARCQALGAAGATDEACLAAWADSRRRFFGLEPRQAEPASLEANMTGAR